MLPSVLSTLKKTIGVRLQCGKKQGERALLLLFAQGMADQVAAQPLEILPVPDLEQADFSPVGQLGRNMIRPVAAVEGDNGGVYRLFKRVAQSLKQVCSVSIEHRAPEYLYASGSFLLITGAGPVGVVWSEWPAIWLVQISQALHECVQRPCGMIIGN